MTPGGGGWGWRGGGWGGEWRAVRVAASTLQRGVISTYHMPDTLPGTGVSCQNEQSPTLMELTFDWQERDKK